ncbi:MAG TPA: imidazole glycerol phosphate synthase subunit HisH [Arachnia sp.]|nr:imidazole glycerol phosphate synthase subunit HisH [Arachnia sp.]HMT85719.1 imidazole glycerol phosphate synthase subunit HisH [Arachnia sp.]
MSPKVGLFDYGSGNLHSAARAFENAGADLVVTGELAELRRQDALVVPGVGAYNACMTALDGAGGVELIRDWVADERPLFGICVGHQVLFEGGNEHGTHTDGVGLYPGQVDKLAIRRLPHMGWNTVEAPEASALFAGLHGRRFYFVHSYAARPWEGDARQATCTEGGEVFVAAVELGAVTSTQFHPEKSGAAGARLLRNWIGTL